MRGIAVLSFAFHILLIGIAALLSSGLTRKVGYPVADIYNVDLVSFSIGSGGATTPEVKPVLPEPTQVIEPKVEKPQTEEETVNLEAKKPKQQEKPKPAPVTAGKTKASSGPTTSGATGQPASRGGGSPGPGGPGGGSGPIRLDAANFGYTYYLNVIRTRIWNNWYPPGGRARSIKAVVFFKILRSGRISDVALETSSGDDMFDRLSLRAVTLTGQLPPLPGDFSGDVLGVHFEFEVASKLR